MATINSNEFIKKQILLEHIRDNIYTVVQGILKTPVSVMIDWELVRENSNIKENIKESRLELIEDVLHLICPNMEKPEDYDPKRFPDPSKGNLWLMQLNTDIEDRFNKTLYPLINRALEDQFKARFWNRKIRIASGLPDFWDPDEYISLSQDFTHVTGKESATALGICYAEFKNTTQKIGSPETTYYWGIDVNLVKMNTIEVFINTLTHECYHAIQTMENVGIDGVAMSGRDKEESKPWNKRAHELDASIYSSAASMLGDPVILEHAIETAIKEDPKVEYDIIKQIMEAGYITMEVVDNCYDLMLNKTNWKYAVIDTEFLSRFDIDQPSLAALNKAANLYLHNNGRYVRKEIYKYLMHMIKVQNLEKHLPK